MHVFENSITPESYLQIGVYIGELFKGMHFGLTFLAFSKGSAYFALASSISFIASISAIAAEYQGDNLGPWKKVCYTEFIMPIVMLACATIRNPVTGFAAWMTIRTFLRIAAYYNLWSEIERYTLKPDELILDSVLDTIELVLILFSLTTKTYYFPLVAGIALATHLYTANTQYESIRMSFVNNQTTSRIILFVGMLSLLPSPSLTAISAFFFATHALTCIVDYFYDDDLTDHYFKTLFN